MVFRNLESALLDALHLPCNPIQNTSKNQNKPTSLGSNTNATCMPSHIKMLDLKKLGPYNTALWTTAILSNIIAQSCLDQYISLYGDKSN